MENLGPREDETLDTLFEGKLKILQKKAGYRFSMDPIFLAYFARPLRGKRALDLGTGCGVIPLILGARGDVSEVVGLEVQEDLVDMARRSCALNSLSHKVKIVHGDFREARKLFSPQSFDHVLSNPPYHSPLTGRVSPVKGRALARQETQGEILHVVEAAKYLLPTKGRLWLIYTPGRLTYVMEVLKAGGFAPYSLRFVHGRVDLPASMVLVEAVRGGKGGTRVLSPLILYQEDGSWTQELERIYSMIG